MVVVGVAVVLVSSWLVAMPCSCTLLQPMQQRADRFPGTASAADPGNYAPGTNRSDASPRTAPATRSDTDQANPAALTDTAPAITPATAPGTDIALDTHQGTADSSSHRERSIYVAGLLSDARRGILPAIHLAVKHINSRRDVLPGYRLKLTWNDTKVSRGCEDGRRARARVAGVQM